MTESPAAGPRRRPSLQISTRDVEAEVERLFGTDGLVVRVRPRAGAFSLVEWALLAGAAAEFGNSHLDLTRRANVQIRGVTSEPLPLLQARWGASGLIGNSAAP